MPLDWNGKMFYNEVMKPTKGQVSGVNSMQAVLSSALKDCLIGSRLVCLDSVDSTNTEAKRRAVQGAPEGLVILSDRQTAGRGRAGRSFHSPAGCGLYLSSLLRPFLPPEQLANFTAWTAVAVCDAVETTCGVRPQIKWTNDLVLNGKKLCGILTELVLNQATGAPDGLVVGIGINVNHQTSDFHEGIRSIATSLSLELGHPVDRTQLAAEVIRALDRTYSHFPAEKSACLTIGKPVRLITPVSSREAVATGIDEEFRLLVTYPDGTRDAISTGEVSVRGMYGYV